jgi:ferredoxin
MDTLIDDLLLLRVSREFQLRGDRIYVNPDITHTRVIAARVRCVQCGYCATVHYTPWRLQYVIRSWLTVSLPNANHYPLPPPPPRRRGPGC